MKTSKLALILTLMLTPCRADELPHPIRVFYQSHSKLVLRELGKDVLAKSWIKIRSVPPHRLVNPDHKILMFEGPELRTILRGSGLETARYVYAIGSDGYVAMMPSEVIRNYSAILALRRDSQALTPQLGEQQIVFPTEETAAVPEIFRRKSDFWAWYVRAVIVGDLPDSLSVGKRQISMAKVGKALASVRYVPPSITRVTDRPCPPVVELPLSRVPGLQGAATIEVKNLYNDAKSVLPSKGFRLLRASAPKGIPVDCGGPFILVKPERAAVHGEYAPDDLLYFVFRIDRAP
ncbi:MAG: hypothetical protein HY074_05025 [Deltaproteobacteria bacterium]|nr:hypothetical protein [Deltaproteobacteria bacterium]